MSLNHCTFMGYLGQDPEIKYLPDGTAVANISVACSEKWKDKVSGEIKEKTEWIRAVVFGKRAEVIAEHFKKGSQIHITTKARTRDYDKDGVKHYVTEFVISEFQFCGQRTDNGGAKATQQAAAYGGKAQQATKQSAPNYPDNNNYPDDFSDDIPF